MANWKIFQQYFNEHAQLNAKIENQDDIDEFVNDFTNIISEAVKVSVSTKKTEKREYLPKEILELISKKNFFRRKFQKTRDFKFKDSMDVLVKIIGKKMFEFRNTKLKNKLTNLKTGDL